MHTHTVLVSQFKLVLTFGVHKQRPTELENITGVAEMTPKRRTKKKVLNHFLELKSPTQIIGQ